MMVVLGSSLLPTYMGMFLSIWCEIFHLVCIAMLARVEEVLLASYHA